jgi:hypothetical protein
MKILKKMTLRRVIGKLSGKRAAQFSAFLFPGLEGNPSTRINLTAER